jgi:hypothetical protein
MPARWQSKRNSKGLGINPGVDVSILDKANETQDAYITNPNMKTADEYKDGEKHGL